MASWMTIEHMNLQITKISILSSFAHSTRIVSGVQRRWRNTKIFRRRIQSSCQRIGSPPQTLHGVSIRQQWTLHDLPDTKGFSMKTYLESNRIKTNSSCVAWCFDLSMKFHLRMAVPCMSDKGANSSTVPYTVAKLPTKRLYTDRLCLLRQQVIDPRSSFLQLSSSRTRDWISEGSACAATKAANRSSCLPSANIQGATVPKKLGGQNNKCAKV